jgi:hypothetical protein
MVIGISDYGDGEYYFSFHILLVVSCSLLRYHECEGWPGWYIWSDNNCPRSFQHVGIERFSGPFAFGLRITPLDGRCQPQTIFASVSRNLKLTEFNNSHGQIITQAELRTERRLAQPQIAEDTASSEVDDDTDLERHSCVSQRVYIHVVDTN